MNWYVINGEDPVDGTEKIMVCSATGYDQALILFASFASNYTCINADIFTKETAKSYGIPYTKIAKTVTLNNNTCRITYDD